MFDYRDFYKLFNARTAVGYQQDYEQLRWIAQDMKVPKGPREAKLRFCKQQAQFLLGLMDLEKKWSVEYYKTATLAELKKDQEFLYNDIARAHYGKGILNPKMAAKTLGREEGPLLAMVASAMRQNIRYAYRHMQFAMHWNHELFLEIYQLLSQDRRVDSKEIRQVIEKHSFEHLEEKMGLKLHDMCGFEDTYRYDLIRNLDWNDIGNLYAMGEYVTENEIALSRFMAGLDEEAVDKMASAYVQGFRKGFFRDGKDILGRKTVAVYYPLGMERMMNKALTLFEEELRYIPFICGVTTTAPNKQYEYDHRFDMAAYFSEEYSEKALAALEKSIENNAEILKAYGGPAVVESFGEIPYAPQMKKDCLMLNEQQQGIYSLYSVRSHELMNRYMSPEYTSYTIIAFPVPEIGPKFEEIFHKMIEVNTLDEQSYEKAQQTIIEALDKGTHVWIRGNGENETDIKVALHPLENPDKETNFYNCGADVNIPVGEVFTSPQLAGTQGVLHVAEAYLDELKYENLKLTFVDGYITDYSCTNFDTEEAGKRYIEENLLFPHDTLPLGEFAIGTNTTAYKMAKDYGILEKLPVLVVEKMGPHFAIGDTCFCQEEDKPAFNPQDRKEVIARDNERSILRKTEPEKAYTNKHTDITLPYDQLGQISAVMEDGSTVDIIRNGMFVLRGTDVLNESLKKEATENV